MNTAARILKQNVVSRSGITSILLTQSQVLVWTLSFAVLLSALSVVYVANLSRVFNAGIQQAEVERNKLNLEWGQLLLAKSSLLMQGNVENNAKEQLNMVVPDHKSVVIVKE